MYRQFIATVAAASIAITALGSTPAFANDDRTAKAIAALLGLAVVGTIIHENRKDKKRQENIYRPAPVHNPPAEVSPRYNPPLYHQPKPKPMPDRVNRKLLPQQCFRSLDTRHGKVRMFGQRCLNRHYDFAHRLPRACHYTFRTYDGQRRGYEARCLRDRGYRLARG